MPTIIKKDAVTLRDADGVAGIYRMDDPFKPHLKALYSPAGHNLVLVSPADHRHHKGVQYALRCADLNFWEEEPGSGHCGLQEILSTEEIENGFEQTLLWREAGGGLRTYHEMRRVCVRREPESGAWVWHWHSRLEALRDHQLVQSPWSKKRADGSKVNYHGLGIRLPWSWGLSYPGIAAVATEGKEVEEADVLGSRVPSITLAGRMDGFQEPPACALTLRQAGNHPWFILRQPFPYLACGPTNLEELAVRKGDHFDEHYTLVAEDR